MRLPMNFTDITYSSDPYGTISQWTHTEQYFSRSRSIEKNIIIIICEPRNTIHFMMQIDGKIQLESTFKQIYDFPTFILAQNNKIVMMSVVFAKNFFLFFRFRIHTSTVYTTELKQNENENEKKNL